jgi:protein-arginine kinase activator protein McsA
MGNNINEIIQKLDELRNQNTQAVDDMDFEKASMIRDEIGKYTEMLEDGMNEE